MDEGVTKFECIWERTPPLPDDAVADLCAWRERLVARGLVGHDPEHDVGYGNLSARIDGLGIVITGTQTGHVPRLTGAHVACLVDHDLARNVVRCRGPVAASSESLTHLAVHGLDPGIGAVIHVHDEARWRAWQGDLPTTPADVPYGTVAMARAFEALYEQGPLAEVRVAVMAGHAGGIIAFGRNLDEAGEALLSRPAPGG